MAEEKSSRKNSVLDSEPAEILWKDRKRHLGMPLSFTRYAVDDSRFISKIGLMRTVTNEILLYRILDLKMSQTLGQKLFGVGTITLFTADQSDSQFSLVNVKKPEQVRRFLSDKIEAEREKRRIAGRELYGAAMSGMVDMDGDGVPD